MSMNFKRKMPLPSEIRDMYPLPKEVLTTKEKRDKEIIDVFTGNSDKFLLIIGPCSADKEEPVMDYVGRLAVIQEKVKDKIIIIPRIYTNKPRTTGEGYKGMIHQPDPTKKEDILEGLIHVRHLHTRAIAETLHVQMRCFILKIIDIFMICFLMLQLEHVQWKISSTD